MTIAEPAGTGDVGPPLLCIAIPTYNRVGFIEPLVTFLIDEIERGSLGSEVQILVSDNASSDDTAKALARMDRPFLKVVTHGMNNGAGYNVRYCLYWAPARHVWILGDDDRPGPGLLQHLIALLREKSPALTYLPPAWVADSRSQCSSQVQITALRSVEATYFTLAAGVNLTFLSSFVFDKARFIEMAGPVDLAAEGDTSLPQLEWFLPLLDGGDQLHMAEAPAVLATSGNSGSYDALYVFGAHFEELVRRYITKNGKLAEILLRDMQERFLLSLIWKLRLGEAGRFGEAGAEKRSSIQDAYRNRPLLGRIALALAQAPLTVARPLYILSAGYGRIARSVRLAYGRHFT